MANAAQKAILTAKISGVLKDLMVKTNAEMVYVNETTTLAAKLTELLDAINGKAASSHTHAQSEVTGLTDALSARPTTDAMNSAISAAISELIGGAPETYDTLKEIADYIAAHADVVTALNQAIGAKADKTTVETLSATVNSIKSVTDALGALASKDKVAETDLEDALKTKIDNASSASHSHSNKTVLDGISSTLVTEWNSKSTVFYSDSEPATLAEGDLWFQLVN